MSDVAVEILRDIRDEIRHTRVDLSGRIDATNARLDAVNARLDATNQRLDHLGSRQVEVETRIGTELVAVVGAIRDLRDTLLEDRRLRDTVADHESRIARLERRAG